MQELDGSTYLLNFGLDYLLYYIIAYGIFTLPLSIIYNWCMDHITYLYKDAVSRIIIGSFIGLIVGLVAGRYIISHYIGDYRSLKSVIVFILVYVSLEAVRGRKHPDNASADSASDEKLISKAK